MKSKGLGTFLGEGQEKTTELWVLGLTELWVYGNLSLEIHTYDKQRVAGGMTRKLRVRP